MDVSEGILLSGIGVVDTANDAGTKNPAAEESSNSEMQEIGHKGGGDVSVSVLMNTPDAAAVDIDVEIVGDRLSGTDRSIGSVDTEANDTPDDEAHQNLQDIKASQLAITQRMNILISKVEEEFDNEINRVQEETERAVKEMRAYGETVVAHIQSQRNAFATVVKSGMGDFQKLNETIARNTKCLEFIQNQFSNTFRETGLSI